VRTRRLIVQAPEGERELLFVGRLTVGRAPECDISVADTKISRRHAEFDATGPMPRVSDLGSRNGLLVNGRKVAGADLSTGDVVTIGDLRIRFEEIVPTAVPPRAPITADRTAVLPIPSAPPPSAPSMDPPVGAAAVRPTPASVEAAPAASPHAAAAALPADPPAADGTDDRTAVLPRPTVPVERGTRPSEPPPADDRTAVIPRPQVPARSPVAAAPAAGSGHGAANAAAAPFAAPVAPAAAAPFASASAPTPARPAPSPVRVPPAVPAAAADTGDTTPAGAPIPQAPAPSSASSATPALSSGSAPVAVTAASEVPPAAALAAPVARGPRFSWSGLVVLVCVALGGLGVLLGALPLMSASASTVDQLSRRQVRTLGGWAGSAVRPDGSVDERVLADVLSQPGVESAVVLDVASGQAMAPGRLLGRAFDSLPVVGPQWRSIDSPTVTMSTGYADAFVPVAAGSRRYVAWIRYAPPSASENGLAVIVGLLSTLVLALLMSMLVRRHTAATMQHFTRQVELVVSGANPKVMDGRLLPGIDRLPGVITYLLEQRRSGATAPGASVATGPTAAGAPGAAPQQIDRVAPPPPVGPAWIEVTPSLSVVATSAHAPDRGMRDWTSAPGRHLLDVLEPGPLCNAVVQGLGALGMAAGAEVSIPVPDQPPVTLTRERSTHVRVELAMR
jgi:hypothetical protein